MEIQPAAFKFERKGFLPILEVTGMIKAMPGIEGVLITIALQFIDKAEKYNGKLMGVNEMVDMNDIPKEMTAVKFYIIFKNEEDYENLTSELQKGLG